MRYAVTVRETCVIESVLVIEADSPDAATEAAKGAAGFLSSVEVVDTTGQVPISVEEYK